MNPARKLPDTVEQASFDLHAEHRQLEETLERVASAPGAPALAESLDRLQSQLRTHFEHEEYPGGLYDSLGACSARFHDRVAALVDAHFRMLSAARSLDHLARSGNASAAELHERARLLVEMLRAHEAEEHALAEAARAGAAAP